MGALSLQATVTSEPWTRCTLMSGMEDTLFSG